MSSARADHAAAAFQAGAALMAFDMVVRADLPWLGAWRMRQALAATAVAARHLRLREDAASLRDVHHLAGSVRGLVDPGPAGRLHRIVRDLARRPTRLAGEALERLGAEIGRAGSGSWLEGSGHDSPITAAAVVARIVAAEGGTTREGEVQAWMAADAVLADRLGWPSPNQARHEALRPYSPGNHLAHRGSLR